MIRQYLFLLLLRAAARGLRRLIKFTASVALLVAAAPVAIVAACAATYAWATGWPPRRLYATALWSLPMVAVWLAASALTAPGSAGVPDGPAWYRVADAPYHAWLAMWRLATSGHGPAAAVAIAPAAIPLGLLAGGLAWSYRIYRMETGSGGLSPGSAISFDRRQWRRQVRSARARIAPSDQPERGRGDRGHDPHRPASGPAGHRPALRPAPLAPGGHRDDRHRQDHAAAAAVGRVHGHRAEPAGGRDRAAPAARRARLQGRRRFAPHRGPRPPGAA